MANDNVPISLLSIVSYNMHGFNQGLHAVENMIDIYHPDVFLLQEHWLTPANLCKFAMFGDYNMFGSSAMNSTVESGMLVGRPYGGVSMLIKKSLRSVTHHIYCEDRFAIVKVCNYIIATVYLPCTGTKNRLSICESILDDLWSWREQYPDCECIIAGDFNTDLNNGDYIANLINSFSSSHSLIRCDDVFPRAKSNTYVNLSLNQSSCIDFMLTSSPVHLHGYDVIDPDINYSDHLPILGNFEYVLLTDEAAAASHKSVSKSPLQLRWDHADLLSYYQFSRIHLEPILYRVINAINQFDMQQSIDYSSIIEELHDEIINVLRTGAELYVPHRRVNFYKYWWDQEMDALKTASIESNQAWKAAGKPRQGPIFEKRQKCRLHYRKQIRTNQALQVSTYSNDLHDALLAKRGKDFWKCWNSKFESNQTCDEVDGIVDVKIIAEKFAKFFSDSYQANDAHRASCLYSEYINQRANYSGFTLQPNELFDAELLGSIIENMSCGKAAGLDGLTAEHLKNCHPILSTILSKLFNLMLLHNRVPTGFFHSYTVPLPKVKNCRSKALSCNDFRGIAISSILSKTFEHCILNRFKRYFSTEDNQFGFKKGLGCTHAIYTVQNTVNSFIKGGSTVNICSLDLSKAFDKTNHSGLLIKLMNRFIPVDLLDTIEHWLSNSWSCIKWFNYFSSSFKISYGVRQGSVLSPILFAIYLDDLVDKRTNGRYWFIILYADDILILASSIGILQTLLHAIERELIWLDLTLNVDKSCCLRIGPRFDANCSSICTLDGHSLSWVNTLKYLGVYLMRFRHFKCSFAQAKRAYFRSLNAIFGKVGRFASEEVVLQLVSSKCLPVLMYGTEACGLGKSDVRSLDFVVFRFLMKLFKTNNMNLILEILSFFTFKLPSTLVTKRSKSFFDKYGSCDNFICKMFAAQPQH